MKSFASFRKSTRLCFSFQFFVVFNFDSGLRVNQDFQLWVPTSREHEAPGFIYLLILHFLVWTQSTLHSTDNCIWVSLWAKNSNIIHALQKPKLHSDLVRLPDCPSISSSYHSALSGTHLPLLAAWSISGVRWEDGEVQSSLIMLSDNDRRGHVWRANDDFWFPFSHNCCRWLLAKCLSQGLICTVTNKKKKKKKVCVIWAPYSGAVEVKRSAAVFLDDLWFGWIFSH